MLDQRLVYFQDGDKTMADGGDSRHWWEGGSIKSEIGSSKGPSLVTDIHHFLPLMKKCSRELVKLQLFSMDYLT